MEINVKHLEYCLVLAISIYYYFFFQFGSDTFFTFLPCSLTIAQFRFMFTFIVNIFLYSTFCNNWIVLIQECVQLSGKDLLS